MLRNNHVFLLRPFQLAEPTTVFVLPVIKSTVNKYVANIATVPESKRDVPFYHKERNHRPEPWSNVRLYINALDKPPGGRIPL